MQEVFEKIIEGLEKIGNIQFSDFTKPLITVEDAVKIVNQVATECNNGWIRCSEQLPEKYGDYLVAWKPLYMRAEDIAQKVGRAVPHYYEIVEYDPDDEALWIGGIEQAQGNYEIIAWQPLPDPYQQKEEQND